MAHRDQAEFGPARVVACARVRRMAFAAPLLAAFLLRATAGRAPELVERHFARGIYPRLGGRLACLTSRAPLSIAELLIALLAAASVAAVAFRWRKGRSPRPSGAARARRVVAVAGVAYLLFLVLWGLNYQRQPLALSLGLDARPAAIDELVATSQALIEEANRLRVGLPEDAAGVMRLGDGLRGALGRVEAGFSTVANGMSVLGGACVRPKPILASALFSWLGISGIYSPFTGEANVNMDVPDPDLPFSASHEAAHQRGLAREDEANYVAYRACRAHRDRDFQYSGVMAAGQYAVGALAGVDPSAARLQAERRSAAVSRDLAAIRAWVARHSGPAMALSERVNDAYLRSQGQAGGVRSYGRMVDLLIAERRPARVP